MNSSVLSVRQLNLYVRSLIEGDIRLNNVTVTGELSNFKDHYSSGHFYFTLKDKDAAIRCVMFRSFASRVLFRPQDGLQVVLRGKVSLYEKDGQYQFYAEEMLSAGAGDLNLQFEQIKEKLQNEGLFDADSKRKLPLFPKKIAVVTSETGAAVQDILNILSRRWPVSNVVLCPVSVQGERAVPEMCDALDRIYQLDFADLIIIGRGGGSTEDLWAFNSEVLARKIYESPIPVISAVGHETDFTICDFVADLRAPTPSAAAELAVPDIDEIFALIEKYRVILKNALVSKYNLCSAKLNTCLNSAVMKNPVDFIINKKHIELDRFSDILKLSLKNNLLSAETKLSKYAAVLDGLSPLKVLSRGYSAIVKDNKNVNSVKQLNVGDSVNLHLVDGCVSCNVTDIKENNNG